MELCNYQDLVGFVQGGQDEHGELKELEFSGMTCRCFQHEYDHLQGVLFIDHLSRLKYDRAVKKKQKREKQYARFREQYLQQFVQIAREHRNSNSELPDEGTVSETDKVSVSLNFNLVTFDDDCRTIQWSKNTICKHTQSEIKRIIAEYQYKAISEIWKVYGEQTYPEQSELM